MNDNLSKVINVDVNEILPNRFQPRIQFNENEILELSDSIKEHGVIQPLVVRQVGDKYEIIAGERRYKASVLAGKDTVPVIVKNLSDRDSAEIALIENVQRKNLTPIEEALSYKKILDMGYTTQELLATKLGKSQSAIANKVRLLNLSDEVQEALLENRISERHARSLLRLKTNTEQNEMLNKIINERMTVRKTDEEISKKINMNEKGENSMNNDSIFNQGFAPVAPATPVAPSPEVPTFDMSTPAAAPVETPAPELNPGAVAPATPSFDIFGPAPAAVPTAPVVETPVAPTVEPIAPVIEPTPVAEVTPAAETVPTPVAEPVAPAIPSFNLEMPVQEPVVAPEPVAPVAPTPAVEPVVAPVVPTIEPIAPVVEPIAPVVEPIAPAIEPTPVVEPAAPAMPSFDVFANMNAQAAEPAAPVAPVTAPIMESNPTEVVQQNENTFDFGPMPEPVAPVAPVTMPAQNQPIEPIIVTDYTKQYDPVMPQVEVAPQVDFKEVINAIRECSAKIEQYGFKIDVEEYDLENLYQAVFKIEK